jgi:hypothetical protein
MINLQRILPKDALQFLASKWLHLDFLVDQKEFETLFCEPFFLFSTLGVQPQGKNTITKEQFLTTWQCYIDTIQSGSIVQDNDYRFFFTAILTQDLGAIRALDLPDNKEIIIPYEPIVQMQLHRFAYSEADGKFHSQAFGKTSVSWGVRISYPQLFQSPTSREVLAGNSFSNIKLFKHIQSWLREVSIATPFIVQGRRMNVPIRLGKNCLPWINKHSDLKQLKVLELNI